MRTLKTVLLLTLAASMSIACGSTEQTTSNANQSGRSSDAAQTANSNAAMTPTVSAPNSNQSAQAGGGPTDAAAIYKTQKCDICHGMDGKGQVKGVPDFTDKAWQQKTTDAAMTEQIKKGKPPQMPAYESKLSEAEITAMVAYIRTFGK